MEEKGQQIQDEKNHRQIILTVTEVVFKMVPLVLQGVKGFVFDFPTCTGASYQFFDIAFVNEDIGYPTVSIGHLAVGNDLILEEVDVIGIFGSV